VARVAYLLAMGVWRLFWVAVIIAVLIGMFTRVYPITDGFGRMFLDFMGILLIFAIFRLLTARRHIDQHRRR